MRVPRRDLPHRAEDVGAVGSHVSAGARGDMAQYLFPDRRARHHQHVVAHRDDLCTAALSVTPGSVRSSTTTDPAGSRAATKLGTESATVPTSMSTASPSTRATAARYSGWSSITATLIRSPPVMVAFCRYFYRQQSPLRRLFCTSKQGEASNVTTADAGEPSPHHDGSLLSAITTRLLPIGFGQLAAWDAAAIAILLAFATLEEPARSLVAAVAALVLAATSVRIAGRHLAGWMLTWISYRLLQHEDRHLGTDPLLVLAPDLRLRQHADRAGNRYGIVGIGDGWTAVVRLHTEPDIGKVTEVLRQACDNADIPLAGAQLLVRADATRREYLLAVRFRPADAPLAALSRGSGELGELRATARAALGVLGEAGYHGTVLEAGELAGELRAILGGQGALADGRQVTGPRVADGWRSWSAGDTTQTCFAALTRPGLPLVLGPHASGARFTVTSYTLCRTTLGRLRADVTIRVVRHRDARGPARSRDLQVPAVPLYGRHEAAVRRTLPLALP
jgi:Putative type VII ESX secretion system translocon, EccE